MSTPALPVGHVIMLSAGPRAGKTHLLERWQRDSVAPTMRLSLSPLDSNPDYFLHRLLEPWPALQQCFRHLLSKNLTPRWGGALGLAIAQSHPDFCLLLDDLHLIHRTEVEAELWNLVRAYPETGTLAIASRYQLPELQRHGCLHLRCDDPFWCESPALADLEDCPTPIWIAVLALFLAGELSLGTLGAELVFRNLARHSPQGLSQLRASWRAAAAEALRTPAAVAHWASIESLIKEKVMSGLGSVSEHFIWELLEALPDPVKTNSPWLTLLEGDRHARCASAIHAQLHYNRALAMATEGSPLYLDALTRLGFLSLSTQDLGQLLAIVTQIEPFLSQVIDPAHRAAIHNLLGSHAWLAGDVARAVGHYQIGAHAMGSSQRELMRESLRAHANLRAIYQMQKRWSQARSHAEAALQIAEAYRFDHTLLSCHLNVEMCAFQPSLVIDLPVRVPLKAFLLPSTVHVFEFLSLVATCMRRVGEYRHALRLVEALIPRASKAGLRSAGFMLSVERMALLYQEGRFREIVDQAQELLNRDLAPESEHGARLCLLIAQARLGKTLEARQMKAALDRSRLTGSVGDQSSLGRLIDCWLAHLEGAPNAATEARALIQQADPSLLNVAAFPIVHDLAPLPPSPLVRVHCFGPLTLSREDRSVARWPRKKAAVLFGHLLLCRAPVSSKDLASAFFYDELAQVHTHVYNFRQVTAAVSGRDLIVSKDGSYSIARDQIAYCDLWVFERYFEKARALELRGLLEVARALYQVAVSVVDGPLFSDLGNELAEVRATFAGQIDHARRLLAT